MTILDTLGRLPIFPAVLAVHIAAGVVALAVFWLPMVLRKGGRAHRRIGWVFVAAMAVVAVTSLVLCAHRALFDTRPSAAVGAAFLGYVGLNTGASAYKGVRVLRTKNRIAPSRNPIDLGLPLLQIAGGLAVIVLGFSRGAALLVGFGVVGGLNGLGALRYWRSVPASKFHWWYQHIGDMMGTSLAALTAFLVVNAPRLGFERFSLLVWIAPALVMVPGALIWIGYYRRRFEGKGAAPVAALLPSPERASMEASGPIS